MEVGNKNAVLLKKVGIIGDIHAEDKAIVNVVAYMKSKECDHIYCTGDLCDGYGSTENVIRLLTKSEVVCVKGNHDLWCLTGEMRDLPGAVKSDSLSRSSLEYLGQLPYCITVKTIAGDALLCHGIIDDVMGKVMEEDTDLAFNSSLIKFVNGSYPSIMINGHSHRRMVKKVGRKTIINAGTLFRDHSPCVCFIDFENRQVEFNNIINNKVNDYCTEYVKF